jgi:O-antigen/teichoic acid export membrane protein
VSTKRRVIGFAAGRATSQVAVILRGILIARLVGPENMGVAATFMVVVSFVEMFSTTGSDRFLIQDEEGAEPKTARTLQLVAMLRGIVLALAILALAWPVSGAFETRTAVWGYIALAIIPLCRGLQNLDWAVQQRALRPKTSVLMGVIGEVSALLVAVIVGYITRDWWASVASMVTQAFVVSLVSHFRAERRWTIGFDREIARRAFRFATPLFVSGLLLFLAMQGDRVAVSIADSLRGSATYDLADLGRYAVAGSIALLPTVICSDLAYAVFLPWIRASTDDAVARRRRRDIVVLYGVFGLLFVAGVSTVGGPILTLLFGQSFGNMALLIALLGTAQAVRILRVTANVAAMSTGNTKNILFGSIGRTTGVGLALAMTLYGQPLEFVAACAVGGELIALSIAEFHVQRSTRSRAGLGWLVPGIVALMATTLILGVWMSRSAGPWLSCAALFLLAGVALAACWHFSPTLRSNIREIAALLRRSKGRTAT